MGRRHSTTQDQVLAAISESLITHGVAPTIEELRSTLGLGSKRTVLRYLKQLEQKGAIERWKGARGLRVLRGDKGTVETRSIPILGLVPAGPRILANQNIDGWVRLPKSIVRAGSQYFLLRVRGDSMNRATVARDTIENGDLVLVRQQSSAKDGDIVVALIDGEATIKR
ncbi:MAG: repressor LexA, partial [Deltaproteobacteria bacterium]|nr:repressor LexA [Deltaproteobacteria bacterium]